MLSEAIGEHRLLSFEPTQHGTAGESRQALDEADIAFGSPDPEASMGATNLRWIHINSGIYTIRPR